MAIRRRRRGTWLPIIGTSQGEPENFDLVPRFWNQDLVSTGSSIIIFPLIPDVPLEPGQINPNVPGQLSQQLGQEYHVQRILGTCSCSVAGLQNDPPTVIFPSILLATCGIFVARANDLQSAGGVNTPIGSASFPELHENYGVGSATTVREPWMWRRSWIFGTSFGTDNTPAPGIRPFASALDFQLMNNLSRGSLRDGPQVDVKSIRRIGNDERLWFTCQVQTLDSVIDIDGNRWLNPNAAGAALPNTNLPDGFAGCLDLRIFGRLVKPHNRSNF